MSGHTKGPWAVEDPMDHCLTIVSNPDAPVYDWKWVATVDWPTEDDFDIPSPEVKANARLIAAAPDLLEALKALYASYKGLADSGDAGNWRLEDTDEGKQARAAITRADGGGA